jgi:integrase
MSKYGIEQGQIVSIRKVSWNTRTGKTEAWLFAYRDQEGRRRHKNFKRKSDAIAYEANTRVQIGEGSHVPDSTSITVKEAGELWLRSSRNAGLEPSTIDMYDQHLRLHIAPFMGREKLAKLSVPFVRAFRDKLHDRGRSPAMVRGIVGSLGAILADAQERGLAVRNAVRELRSRRKHGNRHEDRRNGRLKVGVDIPKPAEVRALLAAATGRWRPLLWTAVFTGLRASELRGLRWDDVDLKHAVLHVRQRADKYNTMGQLKSASASRTVPLPPTLVTELRQWKLQCPKDGKHGLVFPNSRGNVENHANIARRGLIPIVIAAGLTKPALDEHGIPERDSGGEPIVRPKYTGLHTFRHFFASWCINRKEDGGLGLPAKVVQERLGHASIVMTMDTYGHLFPRGDDSAELAAAEKSLLG